MQLLSGLVSVCVDSVSLYIIILKERDVSIFSCRLKAMAHLSSANITIPVEYFDFKCIHAIYHE